MDSETYVDGRYPLSALTARIISAAQEVCRTLGPGFEEVIYQRALAKELPAHRLEYAREVWIDVVYKGEKVGRKRWFHWFSVSVVPSCAGRMYGRQRMVLEAFEAG